MATDVPRDASEDFFSSDDDDDDLSFSDEQITNVFDLMAEGSTARLNAVFQDASKSEAEPCEMTAQCSITKRQQLPCTDKAQRNQGERRKDGSTDKNEKWHIQPRGLLVQLDEEDEKVHTHRRGTLAYTAYPSKEQLPMALGLLEELFPLPAPSDALASSTDLLELDIPPRDEDRRQGGKEAKIQEAASSSPERQPD